MSYTKLEVGYEDWREYWKTHPEEQEAMLQWKKKVDQYRDIIIKALEKNKSPELLRIQTIFKHSFI